LTDPEILARAAVILAEREKARSAELRRLYYKYARKRAGEPHQLGKPKKLLPDEALLLVALERSRYGVEAGCPNGNRWHGDATCTHHVRGSAIAMMAASRLELLWALWATVSDQDGDTVSLTEAHLRGSIVYHDLKALTSR
jgi:hypothetical protein